MDRLGFCGCFLISDCWRYRDLIPYIWGLSFLLLILVLIPGIGQVRNDARRWIGPSSIALQPAEIAKVATVLFLADSVSRRRDQIGKFVTGLGPYLLLLGATFLLVLLEPDLGTAVAIAGSAVAVLFVGGMRVSHLTLLGLASVPVLYFAVVGKEYRLKRFLAFLNPWEDPGGSGWQIIQALYALGPAAFWDRYRVLATKWFYLLTHTDFIFGIGGGDGVLRDQPCGLLFFT